MENLSKKFTDCIKTDKNFIEAYKIVRINSIGKIWLIGGALSRNLSNIIHSDKRKSDFDYDFIVEKLKNKIKLDNEWKIEKNSYGNPKLLKGKIKIDIIPIKTIVSIKRRKLKPTIRNFLTGTPFLPQSIIYDIKREKVFGKRGINSIREKVFGINNKEQAKIYANHKKMPLKKLILKKAKSMGYRLNL